MAMAIGQVQQDGATLKKCQRSPAWGFEAAVHQGWQLGEGVDGFEGGLLVLTRFHIHLMPGVGNSPLFHVPAGHGGPAAGAAIEGEAHR